MVPGLIITADNGTEFHSYTQIEADTGALLYFANPHRSWERGTDENTNGLIRQYLPKRECLANLTQPSVTESRTSSTTAPESASTSVLQRSPMNYSAHKKRCTSKLMLHILPRHYRCAPTAIGAARPLPAPVGTGELTEEIGNSEEETLNRTGHDEDRLSLSVPKDGMGHIAERWSIRRTCVDDFEDRLQVSI